MKLMGKAFKTFRLMDILKVLIEWEATKPANPIEDQIVNLFQSNAVITKQVKAQVDLIFRIGFGKYRKFLPDIRHSSSK